MNVQSFIDEGKKRIDKMQETRLQMSRQLADEVSTVDMWSTYLMPVLAALPEELHQAISFDDSLLPIEDRNEQTVIRPAQLNAIDFAPIDVYVVSDRIVFRPLRAIHTQYYNLFRWEEQLPTDDFTIALLIASELADQNMDVMTGRNMVFEDRCFLLESPATDDDNEMITVLAQIVERLERIAKALERRK